MTPPIKPRAVQSRWEQPNYTGWSVDCASTLIMAIVVLILGGVFILGLNALINRFLGVGW